MGNPLIAFALVADEYENYGDPIRGLRPLFAPLLYDRVGCVFDAEEFSGRFRDNYGLDMTPFIANALKEVLSQVGLLKEANVGCFEVANFDWSPESIDEIQIDQTIELFSRWAKDRLRLTSRNFEDGQLKDAMLTRLARPAFSSIFVDEDLGKKSKRLKGLLGIGALDSSAKDEIYLDYLVADFILSANDSAPEVFDAISKIAYGSLIADAVSGLATPITKPASSKPLRVVLDSPLIMDLLDLNTPEHKIYANGLVELMRAADVMLAVFDHSVDEVRGTITSTLHAYANRDAYGPLAERLRTSAGHKLYAVTVMDSLEARIKEFGITILPSRIYEEARYKKYFPEGRVDQVRNSIGDLHEHLDARIRDSMSVATVARLKGEQRFADSIFDAGTIFVTRNSVLARRVNKALSIGRSGPDPRFTIVTDGQVAGVFWFVSGFGVGRALSRTRLIANCSSAILPKKEIVSRIAGMLEGLSPELKAEFEALMTDRRASLCPMRLTSGIVDAIDEDLSVKVLTAMKEELISPVVKQAAAAEDMLERRETELRRAHEERKDMVVAMQGVVSSVEDMREEDKRSFNEQLAQLEFQLDSKTIALNEKEEAERLRVIESEQKIAIAKNDLQDCERRAKHSIDVLVALIVAIPSICSIVFPDFKSVWFRVALLIVYLLSLRFFLSYLRRFTAWVVSLMFPSKRSYLRGLEQARRQ